MASKLWVYEPEEGRYIRGDEIIEARVRTSYVTSYGQRVEQFTSVMITQARTSDTDAGTSPREWDLWRFEARAPAGRAIEHLLAALSAEPQAVVYLDADDEVQLQPLATPVRPTSSGRSKPAWPEWCGSCDETDRSYFVDDNTLAQCPNCHPSHVGRG